MNINQCIFVGTIQKIKRSHGNIESFHLDINGSACPILKLPNDLDFSIPLTEGLIVGVKAKVSTEVKGGYGTVMNLIVERISIFQEINTELLCS